MDYDESELQRLRELRELLDRLVRSLTRRVFATPLQMQRDVGNALAMLRDVEFPRKDLVKRGLLDLLRELGQRKRETRRYVIMLEGAVRELGLLTRTSPPGE